MPHEVPSTAELVGRNVASIESSLNQKTPAAEKAFNRVLAATLGMADKGLYAYAADLARDNLALTASEGALEAMGEEYGIPRVQPTVWEGMATFDIPDGRTLYLGTSFIGPQGLKYETRASATAPHDEPGSGVLVPIACVDGGPGGNLSVGDVLTIQVPIGGGAGRVATVAAVAALGTPKEDLEAYRQKILDFERSEGGGGNPCDYRQWAQAVPGVRRAYPFSGPPDDIGHAALPGERTVYVECFPEISADGVPPQGLLDLVHGALLADPVSGVSREVLGLTAETLYVRPIERVGLWVTIVGMAVTSGNAGDVRDAIAAAMGVFLENFRPFVHGLDPDFDRMDTVTASIIGREAQNILDAYGGSAQDVLLGTAHGLPVGKYTLKRNEKAYLAGIEFEDAPDA